MRRTLGFSVIELLVVVSIILILTSVLVSYNHDSERYLTLLRERTQLIDTLQRARAMSLNTFTGGVEAPCGVGVHFDNVNHAYFIFSDYPVDGPGGECVPQDRDGNYGVYNEGINRDAQFGRITTVDSRLDFLANNSDGASLTDIIFVPPDPRVFMNGEIVDSVGNPPKVNGIITLGVPGEKSISITVTYAGQVTFKTN